MPVLNSISEFQKDVQQWRKNLHENPELGFQEEWTSDFVASQLDQMNIPYERGLAGTGIVATITGTQNTTGKAIALRADMDALPIEEENQFDHKSKNSGRMHACGHDGHTAMLLGAARYLSENPNFDGTVYLIFQPAEEGLAGAKKMIEEGLFAKYPCDMVFGAHNWPALPLGSIGVLQGPIMASADEFEFQITGKGGHAAMPHQTIDPIQIGAQIIQSLQTIVSRNVDPMDRVVVSVTQFHAGHAHNIIPETAYMQGTVRCFNQDTRKFVHDRIEQIGTSIATAHGATAGFKYHWNYPATVNEDSATEIAYAVASEIVGRSNVQDNSSYAPSMGAEDFSYMLQERKGCYIHIGQATQDSSSSHNQGLHNPKYDFNDDIIPIGISYWVKLVEKCLPLAKD